MKDGGFLFKRILASLLSVSILLGVSGLISGCSDSESSVSTDYKTAEKLENGAILQCFSWDFNTIKECLPDIAAAGFSAVQTSPINNCLEGDGGGMELYGTGKWYYHYQPTDFKIGNYQLGTRDEFKAMCDEAEKYGIKVIVDVIANHTTPTLSEVSEDLINAGGGSFDTLFHKGNSMDIKDYSNRQACTTYKMGGLPDINTERTSFQDYFIDFINDCIECGADGFRYDTAKHIGLPDDPKENDGFENNFWERVTTEVKNAKDLFIYGEVLQGNNDRIADYIDAIGKTTASTYGSKIRSSVSTNFVDTSAVSEYWLGSAPLNIVTWVESHDNYINDGTWEELTNEQVILGWSIIASRKDGTPLFFSRPYNCSIDNMWGMNRIGAQGDDFYKDSRVSAVNFFRTAMAGEDETLVNPNYLTTALMIQRGKKGAVIVNTQDSLKVDFDINLPDGTYIDRVDGKTEYTVKDGKISAENDIPENSVVVLYNEGYVNYSKPAAVGVADDTEFSYSTEELKVKLTCSNTENATYTISSQENAKPVSFKNGDEITLPKPAEGTNITTVELRAENPQGVKTYTRLEFTYKRDYIVSTGAEIYFEKPDSWGDEVNAYVYDFYENENDSWPGTPMEKTSDGKYCYKFISDWQSPYVIFNDGDDSDSVQYPEQQGLEVEPDKTYTIN